MQFHAKNIAVAEKVQAEQEVKLTREILEAVSKEAVREAAMREVEHEVEEVEPGYRHIQEEKYSLERKEFEQSSGRTRKTLTPGKG